WKLCDILSGLPQIYAETVEECIPQHVNMDLVNGISFSKGCYPGQEIIARLKYLGKSKYRLCAATAEAPKPVFPGEPLFTAEQPRQKAGVVIDAVATGKGRCCLSAMLKIDRGEHPPAHLGSADGPGLTLGSLPYSVPVE
ncbi:MAG: folate-binding protein, partial [Gammaproteobacteria bacterium]|nr:folate-binding protein [Gammaproteobacteria bacterium]